MLRHPAGLWIFLVVPKHRHLECLFVMFSELTVIETARGDPRALPASSLPGQQNGQPASLKATWPLLFLAFQLFQTREEVRPQQIQPLSFGPLLAVLQGRGCERGSAAISRSCRRLPYMVPTLFLGHTEQTMTAWFIITSFLSGRPFGDVLGQNS